MRTVRTVEELIDELQKCDPSDTVNIETWDGDYTDSRQVDVDSSLDGYVTLHPGLRL